MAGILDTQNLLPLLMLLIVIALVMSIMDTMSKIRQRKRIEPRTITVIKCVNKDYENTRQFRRGDYVGKIEGKCPKCGSDTIIYTIYSEYPEQTKRGKT